MTLTVKISATKTRIERQLGAALEGKKGWILGAVLLFIYGMYTGLTSGMITNDEAWFLQVLRRHEGGEVLYKDIFFNVTPLSAYLASPFVKIFGSELLVIKVLMSACFTATGLLLLLILQKLGLGKKAQVLVLMAYLAYTPSWVPAAGSLYTPLAYVFILATFLMFLTWIGDGRGMVDGSDRKNRRRLVAIGILCGLTFTTKQNMGVYLFLGVSLGAIVYLATNRQKLRDLLVPSLLLTIGFVGTSMLLLTPIALTGGFERFLEYGFLNRATYIQAAQIPYAAQFIWFRRLLENLRSWGDLLLVYWQTQFLLPPVAFGILFLVWIRSKSDVRRMATLLILFNAVSFAGALPRVDLSHVLPTLPMTLISIAWGLAQFEIDLKPWLRQLIYTLCVLWCSLGIIALIIRPIRWIVRDTHQLSSLPHFRAQLLSKSDLHKWGVATDIIQMTTQGEPLFFLTPSASILYMLTERPNLTPYDYPLVTVFQSGGQEQVVKLFQSGEISWVCFSAMGEHPLSPSLLEEFVQGHMLPVKNTQRCTLYRAPAQEMP